MKKIKEKENKIKLSPSFTILTIFSMPNNFGIMVQRDYTMLEIIKMSGMVHTGGKSPQSGLRNVQTCGITLA